MSASLVPPAALVFVAFAQATFALPGRPAECGALEGARADNVWERAKSPALRQYCNFLASGASKLAGSVGMESEALAAADQADHALPGRAAPSVLRGRALLRLGKVAEAYAALAQARARDERVLDDPAALLAWGRTALRTGHLDEAREAYRALLPRASALAAQERGPAYVEAGLLAMSSGPAGLDEAIAILRQAQREAQDTAQTMAVLALALALDRGGERDEAKAVLAEHVHADPRATLVEARAHQALTAPLGEREAEAMAALALERLDPAAARESWKKFASLPGAPAAWVEHARQHEAALAGKRGPSAAAAPAPGRGGNP